MFTNEPQRMMWQPLGKVCIPIPVCVLAKNVTIALGDCNLAFNVVPDAEASDYVRARAQLSDNLENNPVYALQNLSNKGDYCEVSGFTTDYFSILAKHDVLEYDLLTKCRELFQLGQLTVGNLFKALPSRKHFREHGPRYSGLAISVLTVYKTEREGAKLMIRKRSARTAVHANLLHVIPAGMFQDEWDIVHCVIKELSEELFDEKFDHKRDDPTYIYRDWGSAKVLKGALDSGECELLHSGVILNLMNFRPEICCVLLFNDEKLFRSLEDQFKPNWEYVEHRDIVKVGGRRAMIHYQLDHVEDAFLDSRRSTVDATGEWTPVGLAAFWLGVDLVRRRLSS